MLVLLLKNYNRIDFFLDIRIGIFFISSKKIMVKLAFLLKFNYQNFNNLFC